MSYTIDKYINESKKFFVQIMAVSRVVGQSCQLRHLQRAMMEVVAQQAGCSSKGW